MNKNFTCPHCDGFGVTKSESAQTNTTESYTCPVCLGKGIIDVKKMLNFCINLQANGHID